MPIAHSLKVPSLLPLALPGLCSRPLIARPYSSMLCNTTAFQCRAWQLGNSWLRAFRSYDLRLPSFRRLAHEATRTRGDAISSAGQFWVLSSAATTAGMEGCQIWFHQHLSIFDQKGHCWQRSSFTIVHSEPRILIVLAEAGGLKFGLISAHAHTAAASEEAQLQWWAHLAACVHKLPPACIPICGRDANARFVQDSRRYFFCASQRP